MGILFRKKKNEENKQETALPNAVNQAIKEEKEKQETQKELDENRKLKEQIKQGFADLRLPDVAQKSRKAAAENEAKLNRLWKAVHSIRNRSQKVLYSSMLYSRQIRRVIMMTQKEFNAERRYQTAMIYVKKMLDEGVISRDDYEPFRQFFTDKLADEIYGEFQKTNGRK